MIVATHRGTGIEIVAGIFDQLGADLVVVDSARTALQLDMDAVILLGGADILPFWYGETNRACDHVDKARDQIEWTLVRRALAARLPIMGICRGHQLLAVACGGALYQDIGVDLGRPHGRTSHRLVHVHQPLGRHLPTTHVNSLHHQAVRTVPAGFQTVALSEDGIVESIWRPGMLGVQWHPELLLRSESRWEKLFTWFVREGLQ